MEVYKFPSDKFGVLLDFAPNAPTVPLTLASFSAVNLATLADATSTLINGNPQIQNSTQVLTNLQNGTTGATYLINLNVQDSAGNTFNGQIYVFILPSGLDLTTLDRVKSWAQVVNDSDDINIARCITAVSVFWLWRTGRIPGNGVIPAVSPFVQASQYNENYSGNGHDQLFLRQTPIQSVASLTINGNLIPASTAWGQQGWVINDDGKSLLLRGGGGGSGYYTTYSFGPWWGGPLFYKGVLNINVVYTAGYNGTPPDVQLAVSRIVAKNYKSRNWIGQRSQAMAQGAGTVSFRDFNIEPEDERIIVNYTPTAIT